MDYHYSGSFAYIKPSHIVIKSVYEGGLSGRSHKQRASQINLEKNEHNGILSDKAVSRLRASINWLVSSAEPKRVWSKIDRKCFYFKVNFITLTIPPQSGQLVDEKLFQECFAAFLAYGRKYWYLHNYIWKMECHKDNRLHLHLTTDTFIHYRRLRSCWNRILARKGLLQDHFSRFGNTDPNSTDIHSVKDVKNLSGYLCKYMSKNPKLAGGYKGRIWGTSYSISDARKCSVFISADEISKQLRWTDSSCIKYRPITTEPNALGESTTIADMFLITARNWERNIRGVVRDTYNEHRAKIRDGTANIPPEYLMVESFKSNTNKNINLDIINLIPNIKCEIEISTQKIGWTQSVLPF